MELSELYESYFGCFVILFTRESQGVYTSKDPNKQFQRYWTSFTYFASTTKNNRRVFKKYIRAIIIFLVNPIISSVTPNICRHSYRSNYVINLVVLRDLICDLVIVFKLLIIAATGIKLTRPTNILLTRLCKRECVRFVKHIFSMTWMYESFFFFFFLFFLLDI